MATRHRPRSARQVGCLVRRDPDVDHGGPEILRHQFSSSRDVRAAGQKREVVHDRQGMDSETSSRWHRYFMGNPNHTSPSRPALCRSSKATDGLSPSRPRYADLRRRRTFVVVPGASCHRGRGVRDETRPRQSRRCAHPCSNRDYFLFADRCGRRMGKLMQKRFADKVSS